ncbi:AlkA N-terminal domain-containing protein [Fodinicola acaciae]|uniref:AlkA N-terminal domain-containing protein n=1 Tax=Fodinicola acaciae TaxID=2681555 RepID=UPI0013D53CC7|nr:AlkA N-terminal domain-containing protein [Fodinicola acaciae]
MPDLDICYRAVSSRDARFDGWFVMAVQTTGIYCRPSCPAMTPRRVNVSFYPTAAAAQKAGFRACLRCRPDAAPGSPEWNTRADLVARAMRLIGDGVVERDGVTGLASRLGYTERHLHRQLVAELGAGALALARAQRAQTARVLIETTKIPFADIAFASGFASIRQFNDTIREVFAATPTQLRGKFRGSESAPGGITVRLPYRPPFDADGLADFLKARQVTGIEEWTGATYKRALRLPHGMATMALTPMPGYVECTLRLADLRDLSTAVWRARRLYDLDADPVAVDAALSADPALEPLVLKRPGVRVPGAVDGLEIAVRAVVGQQISVSAARTVLGKMVAALGEPLAEPDGALTHVFPIAEALAAAPDEALPMPESRKRTIRALGAAVADGRVDLHPAAAVDEVTEALCALPGIGPWTAGYVAMRALADPDAFLPTDLGIKRAAEAHGLPADPAALTERAAAWRPWRAYALMHLWHS